MTNEERDIQRKLRVLQHAEKIGNARKACRYFDVGTFSVLDHYVTENEQRAILVT